MPALEKTSLALFSACSVLLTSLSQGAYNGDIDYPTLQGSPTNRGEICLDTDCPGGLPYQGGIQHSDCDQAGYGTPRPLRHSGDASPNAALREWLNQSPSTELDEVEQRVWDIVLAGDLFDLDDGATSAPTLTLKTDGSKDGLNYDDDVFNWALFANYRDNGANIWPGGVGFNDYGYDRGPIRGSFDNTGRSDVSGIDWSSPGYPRGAGGRSNADLTLSGRGFGSLNFEYNNQFTAGGAPTNRAPHNPFNLFAATRQNLDFGGRRFESIKYGHGLEPMYREQLEVTVGVILVEVNGCRVVLVPADPNYTRTGRHEGNSWGARLDDQWAIKRVGFTADDDSAWNQVPENADSVVVAVIDTGLDWHHKDMSPENIWRNPNEVPDNGVDDDGNGYIDDLIGWNFLGRNNMPWDFDGHGTVVAGIIAAAQDNDTGIAGINPHAKIMVLKGVNNFGTTRASYLAEAIKYAADNGARIINLSVGGPKLTQIEQAAIDYAHSKDVLIIAASGNEGIEFDDYGPSGGEHVLTVGATHTDDRAADFSNYGDKVDLVAPGVDVLSLRARFTDANFRPETTAGCTIGDRYVGDDKRYLHVNGTSFSTPIVSGVASLLMAKHPQLSAADVERLLYETAEDIEFPGKDKYAGHGMVDAKAALSAQPDFFITAEISGLEFQQVEDKDQIRVVGTIGAQAFKRAWLEIGAGENPARWKAVGQKRKRAIENGTLSTIDLSEFSGSDLWQVVVNVEHRNGVVKKVVRPLRIQ